MPHPILIEPTSRSLGGATSDFSLYGAQPALFIGAARPTGDPALVLVPAPAPDRASGQQPNQVEPSPPAPAAIASDTSDVAPTTSYLPQGGTTPLIATPAVAAPDLQPLVPAPTGAGSVLAAGADPIAQPPALTLADSAADPASSLAVAPFSLTAPLMAPIEAAAALPAEAAALAAAATALTAPLLAQADALVAEAGSTVVTSVDSLAATTTTVTDEALDTAVGAAASITTAAGDATEDVLAAADAVAGATTTTLASTADAAGSVVADVAAAPLTVAGDGIAAASPLLDQLASDAGDGIAATLGRPGDAAQEADALPAVELFAGSDPAGGVQTLADMVSTADSFLLGDSVAPDAAADTGGLTDTLALDSQIAPLLGGEAGDGHGGDESASDDPLAHVHDVLGGL
jgi:hypothetical protein